MLSKIGGSWNAESLEDWEIEACKVIASKASELEEAEIKKARAKNK